MTAFKRHGIEYLSPSSLNLWNENPRLWAVKYLYKVRDETGPAAARGLAVEAGFSQLLHGKDFATALAIAMASYDQNQQGVIEKERGLIESMLNQCAAHIVEGGASRPDASQLKVEHWFEGVSIPVLGYLDFSFSDFDLDLKTTARLPSEPRPSHVRQVSLYRAARNKPGSILYVTDKKRALYEISDTQRDDALADLQGAALSLQRYLEFMPTAEDAVRCLPSNIDHYTWFDAAKQKLADLHL